jgi:mannitol-1-phosphate 5-dehydrogenase
MKLVQIGAGNIGRSFIGQLFSRAGYEVVFLDVVPEIIKALNERRSYVIEIKDDRPETLVIENVRAVNSRDVDAAAAEIASADIAATAVGPNVLPHVYPLLARGIALRHDQGGGPLDIIIAENLRNAADHFREGLRPHLPEGFPLDEMVGLVETSIGKMVPIMTREQKKGDPTLIFAEAYNTLIVDAKAFKNPIPNVPGLSPKQNMAAYVDRKLFIHNLGHGVCVYLGHLALPDARFTWQVIQDPTLGPAVREGMWESARALISEYPDEFNEQNLGEHIEDLLRRFANKALGDTIYRVGRDITRKLGPQDRMIGSLRLCAKHNVPAPTITLATAAAMLFRAVDERGEMFPPDRQFAEQVYPAGPEHVLRTVCQLKPSDPRDALIMRNVLAAHRFLVQQRERGLPWVGKFRLRG